MMDVGNFLDLFVCVLVFTRFILEVHRDSSRCLGRHRYAGGTCNSDYKYRDRDFMTGIIFSHSPDQYYEKIPMKKL